MVGASFSLSRVKLSHQLLGRSLWRGHQLVNEQHQWHRSITKGPTSHRSVSGSQQHMGRLPTFLTHRRGSLLSCSTTSDQSPAFRNSVAATTDHVLRSPTTEEQVLEKHWPASTSLFIQLTTWNLRNTARLLKTNANPMKHPAKHQVRQPHPTGHTQQALIARGRGVQK